MRVPLPFTRALAAVTLVAALTACDESSAPDPIAPPPTRSVAAVEITGDVPPLAVGAEVTVNATLKDASGQPIEGRAVAWSTSDPTVASVSTAGLVRAVAPGVARVSAASEGKVASVTVTVLRTPAASVTLDHPTVVLEAGETRRLTATPRDAQGAPIAGLTVLWASGAADVATVSADGVITAVAMGRATISAVVDGKRADAAVTVLGTSAFDLVLDRWDTSGGNVMRPWLHRLDLRTPDATPARIFDVAGSADASPSPDGSRIAFVCYNDAPGICVANRDGTGLVLLPGFSQFNGLLADQPAWSPDGSKIAFRGWMPGGPPGIHNPADIWVMNADGSGKVKITAAARDVDAYESPTWSPRQGDGSYRIAFAHTTRGADGYMRSNIEAARADGLNRYPVTPVRGHMDTQPAWSPDGATIAFVRDGGEVGSDIWLASATGGSERSLLPADPFNVQRAPAWSPDGGLIAFASNHEIIVNYYAYQIYTVRTDGTRLTRRTEGTAEKGNPSWIRR